MLPILAASTVVLLLLAVILVFRRRINSSPKILLLHSLAPRISDSSSVSLKRFTELIEAVDQRGLQLGSIEDCLRDHTKVAITFDDGYDDLMQLVPILQQRKIPITVMLPTAFIGRENSWDNFLNAGKRRHLKIAQIRELAQLGVTFGSHGHTHRDLTSLSDSDLESELNASKAALHDINGSDSTILAFPFGLHNNRVLVASQQLGFATYLTSTPSSVSTQSTAPTKSTPSRILLGRIPINKFDNRFSISIKLGHGFLTAIEALKSVIISKFAYLTPVSLRNKPLQ